MFDQQRRVIVVDLKKEKHLIAEHLATIQPNPHTPMDRNTQTKVTAHTSVQTATIIEEAVAVMIAVDSIASKITIDEASPLAGTTNPNQTLLLMQTSQNTIRATTTITHVTSHHLDTVATTVVQHHLILARIPTILGTGNDLVAHILPKMTTFLSVAAQRSRVPLNHHHRTAMIPMQTLIVIQIINKVTKDTTTAVRLPIRRHADIPRRYVTH